MHLPDHPELGFNLSHSGDWIVLATASHGQVGVDIETIDPTFPALEIAEEFFLLEERRWIRKGADPTLRFFQLWTAKEALMKATGEGMSLPPDQILITPSGDRLESATNLRTGRVHELLTETAAPAGMALCTVFLTDGE